MSRVISIKWSTDDVLHQAKEDSVELTEEQAIEILEILDRKHDATIGINWDVISSHIDMYLHPYDPPPKKEEDGH